MISKVEVREFNDKFVKDTLSDFVQLLQEGYKGVSKQGLDYQTFDNVEVNGVPIKYLGLISLVSKFEATFNLYDNDGKLKADSSKSLKSFLGEDYDVVSGKGESLHVKYNKVSTHESQQKVNSFLEKFKNDFRLWRQDVKKKHLDPVKKDEMEFYSRKEKLDQLSGKLTSEIDNLKV